MKLFALVFVVAACGAKPAPNAPENASTAAPAVELAEITVFDGDQAMLKLHADGTTELGGHSGRADLMPGTAFSSDSLPVVWKPGPVVLGDGTIEFEGKARVRINADGTITNLEKATPLAFAVKDDRVMLESGKGIALAADGTVTILGGRADKVIRVAGADTVAKRRLVLGFMAMMFMSKPEPAETITTTTTTTTDD